MTISEFLMPLTQPLGFVWAILLLASLINFRRKHPGMGWLMAALVVFLSALDCTPLAPYLLGQLENPYLAHTVRNATPCDAIVLLGGGSFVSMEENYHLGLGNHSARLIAAAELMRERKGNVLVLGGAGRRFGEKLELESDPVRLWLSSWKVFEAPIVALGESHNTHDEAVATAKLAGASNWKKIGLVTSAWHMRRATAVFQAVGLDVEPIATDFQASGVESRFRTVIPTGDGLRVMGYYLHEEIGWFVYKHRGWITK
jgi:uncharacterized SAM-binding protein YcdF (DUF218 family)